MGRLVEDTETEFTRSLAVDSVSRLYFRPNVVADEESNNNNNDKNCLDVGVWSTNNLTDPYGSELSPRNPFVLRIDLWIKGYRTFMTLSFF